MNRSALGRAGHCLPNVGDLESDGDDGGPEVLLDWGMAFFPFEV